MNELESARIISKMDNTYEVHSSDRASKNT